MSMYPVKHQILCSTNTLWITSRTMYYSFQTTTIVIIGIKSNNILNSIILHLFKYCRYITFKIIKENMKLFLCSNPLNNKNVLIIYNVILYKF